jgi:hypothetical protein
MEPESSLPHFSPIYSWVFQVASFHQVFLPKPCIHFSFSQYVLNAPPISFFSIWSTEQYWVSSTDPKTRHYVVFSTHLLPHPS